MLQAFTDSFTSFLSGLGVLGRDKTVAAVPIIRTLSVQDLTNLYRSDWLSRKICDVPAFDQCRAWRQWEADRDQINALETAERAFGLQGKVMEALTKARLFGGSALVMGVEGTGAWNEELNLERVKPQSLKFVHAVERWMIPAGPRIRDITNPWFGEPTYYMRANIPVVPAPGGVEAPESFKLGGKGDDNTGGSTMYIHPSRVVRFIGLNYPDMEMSPDPWGDSVLQPIYDTIRDANLVSQSIAACIAEMKVDVIKVQGLSNTLSTDAGASALSSRWARANAAKSVINAILIDQNEELTRLYPQFGGVHELLEMYLLMAAAAADIPSTRLLSREPAGQNATGASDTRNYYDRLSADQKVRVTPTLSRLDEVLIRSTLGRRPAELTYNWNPLWQLDETQKADILLKKAQAFKIDNDAGIIPAEVLQEARVNQLIEDNTYPGLDQTIQDYEELMQQEQSDFELESGRPQEEVNRAEQVERPEEAATSDALAFFTPNGGKRKLAKKANGGTKLIAAE